MDLNFIGPLTMIFLTIMALHNSMKLLAFLLPSGQLEDEDSLLTFIFCPSRTGEMLALDNLNTISNPVWAMEAYCNVLMVESRMRSTVSSRERVILREYDI